jgi:tetratricopeptide (TPR) repeat protein
LKYAIDITALFAVSSSDGNPATKDSVSADIDQVMNRMLPVRKGLAKLAIVAGVGLTAVALSAGLLVWTLSGPEIDPGMQLNVGLRLLKRNKPQDARLLIGAIDEAKVAPGSDQSKRLLILGAASLDEAEGLQVPRFSHSKTTEAESYLSKANKLGFPRGYEGFGNLLLGKALFQLFRWDEAVAPLEIAVAQWPDGRTEALERLIDIKLGADEIDVEAANVLVDEWAHMPGLTDEERNLGKVKAMELSLAINDTERIEKQVHNFPRDSKFTPHADYLLARSLLKNLDSRTGEEKSNDIARIESLLSSVLKQPTAEELIRRRAEYYLGVNRKNDGQLKSALTTFVNLRQKSPDSIEGVVASIEEMQILLELNQYRDVADSLELLKSHFGKLEWYRNAWVGFDELRRHVNSLGQGLLEKEAYAEVLDFADRQPAFCEPVDRLFLIAEGARRWADDLRGRTVQQDVLLDIRDAEKNRQTYKELNKRQQELYSKAAKAYEELANAELRSPSFHSRLWLAVHCSQAAGELEYCNALIRRAMDFENRDDKPRSLIKMAENLFAMQQPDQSLVLLDRCIELYRDHPLVYNARLNSARILNERNSFDQAVSRLEENLYLGSLKPESSVWRESLFELGKSLFRQGEILYLESERAKDSLAASPQGKRIENLEKAYNFFLSSIDRLEEWIERFPDDKRRFDTLYTVGQAYQIAAEWPRLLIEEEQLPTEELNRAKLIEQRRLMDSARKTFKQIREGMSTAQEWSTLEPSQQRLLRNSYFAEADLMFLAKNYEGALTAYRNIASRLVNEPESLEALVQAAECLKALGRKEESVGIVAQAHDILKQIPAEREPHFATATRFTREGWAKHLDWMKANTL